ncbi:MAG: four helix bundle protein [Planctomycetaceae bacterium]|nr:four helix bundle protein [Planctomycetaceae bacterium]
MGDTNSPQRKSKVVRHTDLEVYQRAFKAAMDVFRLSKSFPAEERYSLTDQVRRSSRSVAANITEAWRKRRYQGSFVNKLNDAEGEAAETQTWLQFAVECGYVEAESTRALYSAYDAIVAMLVNMQNHSDDWVITKRQEKRP